MVTTKSNRRKEELETRTRHSRMQPRHSRLRSGIHRDKPLNLRDKIKALIHKRNKPVLILVALMVLITFQMTSCVGIANAPIGVLPVSGSLSDNVDGKIEDGLIGNFYFITNQLGSVMHSLDTKGRVIRSYVYQPFGKFNPALSTMAILQPEQAKALSPKFTGQKYESTIGLYNYKARFYDQETGRFLQPDPIQSERLGYDNYDAYQYVYNNPTNFTDPSGMVPILKAMVGGFRAFARWENFTIKNVAGAIGWAGRSIQQGVGWARRSTINGTRWAGRSTTNGLSWVINSGFGGLRWASGGIQSAMDAVNVFTFGKDHNCPSYSMCSLNDALSGNFNPIYGKYTGPGRLDSSQLAPDLMLNLLLVIVLSDSDSSEGANLFKTIVFLTWLKKYMARGSSPVDDNSRKHDAAGDWKSRSGMKGNSAWITDSWKDITNPAQYFRGRSFYTGLRMWIGDIYITLIGTVIFGLVNLFYIRHPYL